MTTAATSLLGLALPVTGELSGTWGDTVNNQITSLLDSAIAGTTTISTDADVTLTTTTLAANEARQAILLCTGARTALRTITAPARSKTYIIINATTGGFSVKIVGAGPTTGVTIPAGFSAQVAWNGSDFIGTGAAAGGSSTQVQYNSAGAFAGSSNMTFDGTKLTVAGLKDSALTSGRIPYATTSGELTDSANMTFDGTKLTIAGLKDSALTSGRVPYATTSGELIDSANLQFNGTTLTVANDTLVNGLTVGRGTGAISSNTAVGAGVLASTTSATNNTAIGSSALAAATTGGYNTAVGANAANAINTGLLNTAIGTGALVSGTSASYNVAVGSSALYLNVSGWQNTAVGYGALLQNTAPSNNTGIGFQAGYTNAGLDVTVVGSQAGYYHTDTNDAFGYQALFGVSSASTGIHNVAIGRRALVNNTTGSYNVAVGRLALSTNSSGSYNTAVGYGAGSSMATGSYNVIVGSFSGTNGTLDITNSSNNIILSDGQGNARWYSNSVGVNGYPAGNGGSVTQATSRTTAVTLNKPCGTITLVSAAGSASYQTFTVNNSTVLANDTIIVSQKSGTDKYIAMVTAVASGSFNITFATTGGTTTESPVFNFAVIRAMPN